MTHKSNAPTAGPDTTGIGPQINSLCEIHNTVAGFYATKLVEWPGFMENFNDKLLRAIDGLRQNRNITEDLLEACIQARAALPDAWFSEKCGVPVEIVYLLNEAIGNAERAGIDPNVMPQRISSWDYHQHGCHKNFSKEEWQSGVTNEETLFGYQEWVEHKIEELLHDTDLEGVDAIEVAGCTEDDGIVEVSDEQEAEFFSVYTHTPDQGVECICDFNTKDQAVEFAYFLAERTRIPVYGNLCSIKGRSNCPMTHGSAVSCQHCDECNINLPTGIPVNRGLFSIEVNHES